MRALRRLLLALLLISASASASTPTGAAAPSAAVSPATVAIPIRDILVRSVEEQQRIDAARELIASSHQLDTMRVELERIAAQVNAKLDSTSGALDELPVMRLESLSRHFDFNARRLQAWEARARRAFDPYDESAMQLAQSRAAWTATRTSSAGSRLPAVLSQRAEAVLSNIDAAEAGLADILKQELALMQRASEIKARIAVGRRQVAAAIEQLDERLLRFDAPPLWRASAFADGTGRVWDEIGRGLAIESQFARDYNEAGTGNQLALRLMQALLLPLMLWLGAHGRRVAREEGGTVPTALRRPVSSWVLLSMLGVLVLEPDAPLLVQEVALAAAVIPVLRLLPQKFVHESGRWTYAAVVLYALDRVSVAAVADNGVYRWLLLTLTMLALALGRHAMLHLGHTGQASLTRGRVAVLRVLGTAAMVALAISLLCNVLGNVTLSETLTSGVIDSVYMAILMYASAICCRDVVRSLMLRAALMRHRIVARHAGELRATLSRVIKLAVLLGWLVYALDRFRLLLPLQQAFNTVMAFGIEIGEVSVHIGEVITLAVSTWLALWSAAAVRRVLREELPGRPSLARGVGSSIASLSYYMVLMLGLLFALSAAGVKLGQLAIVFGALGVGIGFGLQNVVNNFVSGLVLMFERPIQPGDTVDAAGVTGTVREIGLRSTTIRTADGADAVIPNGILLNGSLINWTMYDRSRRFELSVGVAYDADPAQVLRLLSELVHDSKGIAQVPAPAIMMTGYGESALKFLVSVWLDDPGQWNAIRGDLLMQILSTLRNAGIPIPYNQLDVNLHGPSPEPTG